MSERDHPVIWLQPWCLDCERASGNGEGRMWCKDNVWGKCEEGCGREATKYVLATFGGMEDLRWKHT